LYIVATCPELIVNLRRERARITDTIGRLKTAQRLLGIVLDTAPPAIVAEADRIDPDEAGHAARTSSR
jgi:hypothetical protein